MVEGEKSRVAVVEAVKKPLGFFVLALMQIEILIGVLSAMGTPQLLTLSLLATFMFVLVVIAVVFLVVKAPAALLAEKPSDLYPVMDKIIKLLGAVKAKTELGTEPLSADTVKRIRSEEVPTTREGTPMVRAPPPRAKG